MGKPIFVNVVDQVTLAVGVLLVLTLMALRWWRGQPVHSGQIASDLLNGITLTPFFMLTSAVFYPQIFAEIEKNPLFVSVAGVISIVRVATELYKPFTRDEDKARDGDP